MSKHKSPYFIFWGFLKYSTLIINMADQTPVQRLGTGYAFNESTKVLSINLNNLSSIIIGGADYGLNVSAITTANFSSYVVKILWALLMLNRVNQGASDNDNTVGMYIQNQGKRSITRNSVAQTGFSLLVTGYKNDTDGFELDPDTIA
jgi:hypothetical protein